MRAPSLLLSLLVFTVVSGCGAPEPGPAPSDAGANVAAPAQRVVRVESLRLQPTSFEDVIQLTGAVEAPNDASLSAQTGGTVESIVPLGRFLKAGDIVAQLDDALLRATLQQARAQLDVARAQETLAASLLRRQEALYRDSIISVLEFENVRTQAVQAQAERSRAEAFVTQAEKQVENTLVRSPFDGTVEERFVEKGEQLLPGAPVARIVNTASIRVAAGVPERYATDVRDGSTATVSFQAYGVEERQGRIAFASRVIDPVSRSFRIEIDLANPGGRLKPAMIANVHIVRARLEDRIVIPQTAVMADETTSSVFVVMQDGGARRAQRRLVRLGASYGGRVVVEEGLAAGDEIIVVGQTNVTEGDVVETTVATQAS